MGKGIYLITLGALIVLSYITISASSIWAIVEFILYLVKDHSFNWWSVWLIPIAILVTIVSSILIMLNKPTPVKKMNTNKSNFQKRLEELRKQKEQN